MQGSFRAATIEISNICNASCRWCTTGSKNRVKKFTTPNFMSAASFEKGIAYMLDNNIINKNTEIELYNWGEPLLNPELQDILAILDKYELHFHISTNASVIKNFTGDHIDRMTMFMVSLSGFSQKTYGKIHGLDLDTVLHNIDTIADILKNHGKLNCMQINMHMYKFNLEEYELARQYFQDKNIRFIPRLAYFNDYNQFQNYLNNSSSKKVQAYIDKQIITTMLDDIAANAPVDYICPQQTKIVTDEEWNIVPCCRLTSNEKLGNLFELSYDEIKKRKGDCEYCAPCLKSKQSFIVHQNMEFFMGIRCL